MKGYILIGALGVCLSAAFFAVPASAQEKGTSAANPAPSESAGVAAIVKDEAVGPKDLSVYGEVQAVNPSSNSLAIQYYNYDTDEEKTIEVAVNGDTKMENAAGLNDIKKGDWVDATYVTSNGKNVARAVIVEKEEAITEDAAQNTVTDTAATPAEE